MPQAEDILSFIEKLENPNVAIDQARCLKVRNRNASCQRCVDACSGECIGYENNRIFFDASRCVGCLACCTACPTSAMSSKRYPDTAIFAAARAVLEETPGHVTFACEHLLAAAKDLYNPKAVVQLPCVASVDVSMLVYLASLGASELVLVTGECAACDREYALHTARHVEETANTLLKTWPSASHVKISSKLPACTKRTEDLGYDASRRGFFTDMRTETRKMAADASNVALDKAFGKKEEESFINKIKVNSNGTLPLLANARRERLLAALDSFGLPEDEMIETDLWGQVIIDLDKCKACRICATFCPSGALFKFHTKSGKIGVKQMVRDCIDCRCCLDVCLHEALTLCPEVFARDIAEGTVERYQMEEPRAQTKFSFNG